MCGVCEQKTSKADNVTYRIRISGRAVLIHQGCEWAAINDTRIIKEVK